jgi:prepilin-type processing-associated H-X9-DG protein
MTENDARGVWALGHAGASLITGYGSGGDDNGPNATYSNADDVNCGADLTDPAGVCTTNKNSLATNEKMNCHDGAFDQATVRSKHPGGVHVAFADGSVQFVTEEVEGGCYTPCCTAWDYMIASSDEGRVGALTATTLTYPCKY